MLWKPAGEPQPTPSPSCPAVRAPRAPHDLPWSTSTLPGQQELHHRPGMNDWRRKRPALAFRTGRRRWPACAIASHPRRRAASKGRRGFGRQPDGTCGGATCARQDRVPIHRHAQKQRGPPIGGPLPSPRCRRHQPLRFGFAVFFMPALLAGLVRAAGRLPARAGVFFGAAMWASSVGVRSSSAHPRKITTRQF